MVDWVAAAPGRQFLSVIVVGELARGVELLRRRDPQQSRAHADWLAALVHDCAESILPVTVQIAEAWGRLGALRPRPASDGLIAATAQVHGLTLVTRNVRDFEDAGVQLLNPFSP